jgi:hypothetical protein
MRNATNLWKSLGLAAMLAIPAHAAWTAENTKSQGITDVELPAILAPMVVENRLENYSYITIALSPVSREGALAIREKVPFLQDAFLREVNKASIVKAGDPKAVDTEALKPRLLARMNKILPPGTVADLKFERIVPAPMQPQS